MNLTLIPLLIAALLLASSDQEVESVDIVLTGEHRVVDHDDALIVGDALVIIPAEAEVPGPIYVIGGELVVEGTVIGDVSQLAGSVRIESGAKVAGELQHVAGTLAVDDDAHIGRRSSLDVTGVAARSSGLPVQGTLTLVLGGIGYLVARRRPEALANVSAAARSHPGVTITVGLLVSLTSIAVVVFMAFTVVLIPVAVVFLLAGLITWGYGLIAIGHLIGVRIPTRRPAFGTGLGVALSIIGLRLTGSIPVIGDLVVVGVLLAGVGAALVTYFGVSEFRPDSLSD